MWPLCLCKLSGESLTPSHHLFSPGVRLSYVFPHFLTSLEDFVLLTSYIVMSCKRKPLSWLICEDKLFSKMMKWNNFCELLSHLSAVTGFKSLLKSFHSFSFTLILILCLCLFFQKVHFPRSFLSSLKLLWRQKTNSEIKNCKNSSVSRKVTALEYWAIEKVQEVGVEMRARWGALAPPESQTHYRAKVTVVA